MRNSAEFRQTIGAGLRAGRRSVVVHIRPVGPEDQGPTRVGFVVSKQVGNAVTRNRVKRRLRHMMRPMLTELTECAAAGIVVRALPMAASEPWRVETDLRAACAAALARL